MKNTKYQLIKAKVNVVGETVKLVADTDKQYERIAGLYVSLPKDELYYGSTLELKIADKEIFPEGFEAKMLACNQAVNPNERFFYFDIDEHIEAAGSHIEGKFTDGRFPFNPFEAYQVILYLKLKNNPKKDECTQ